MSGGGAGIAANAGFGVGAGGEEAGSAAAGAAVGAGIGSALLSGGITIGLSFAASALLGKFAKKSHQQRPPLFLDAPQSSVTSASPRVWAIGRRIRTPCYLLYASTPQRNQQTGGKGGAQAKANVRPVFQDMAYAINDRWTNRVIRLYLNGRIVYFTERNLVYIETNRWAATSLGSAINVQMTDRLETDLSKVFVQLVRGGGSATAGSVSTLTVAGNPWTSGQWAGYVVYLVSGTGAGSFGVVQSNTTNTLTLYAGWNFAVAAGAGTGFEFDGANDHVKLTGWGANDGYQLVYQLTPPTNSVGAIMELVPRDGQSPTSAPGGSALSPARIERADNAIISSFMQFTAAPVTTGFTLAIPGTLAEYDPYLKFRVGDHVVLRNFRRNGTVTFTGGSFIITQIGFTTGQGFPGLGANKPAFFIGLQADGWSVTTGGTFDAGTYNAAGRIEWDTQSNWLSGSMTAANFYHGDDAQTADSILTAHLGTDTPAFRGMSYLSMANINRTDYGNAPQTAEVVQEVDPTYSDLGKILQAIHVMAGEPADSADGSLCSDILFYGGYRRGPQSAVQMISAVSMFWQVANQDRGGTIVYFPVSACPQVALTNGPTFSELGASSTGKSVPKVLKTATSFRDLPNAVTVKYQNIARAMVDDSATFALRHPSGNSTISADAPDFSFLSAPPNIARDAATSMLRRAVVNGNKRTLGLTARRLNVLENDALTFTDDDGDAQVVRVVDGTLSLDTWLMAVTGVEEDLALRVGGSSIESFGGSAPSSTTGPAIPTLNFQILDIPPLDNSQAHVAGLYLAACSKEGGQWPGSTAWLSLDGGSNYRKVAAFDAEVAIGAAVSTLADASAPAEVSSVVTKDTINTVTIRLDALGVPGGLSSASTASVLAGQNWCMLGGEILAFETATQVDAHTWTLSNLYRGLRRTVYTGHTSSDAFVLLTHFLRDGGRFAIIPAGAGATIMLKCVPAGATLADVSAVSMTFQGWNVRPMPIFDGGAVPCTRVLDGSNDVYFNMRPHTRLLLPLGTIEPFPFDESFEEFVIRIYTNNTYTTLASTTTFTTKDATGIVSSQRLADRLFYYTAAMQTDDGLTPGNTIYFDISQTGDFGSGRAIRYSI